MTRILHVITTIDWGGAEKQLLILAKAQMRSGSKVEVFVLKGKLEMLSALEDAGVKVHALSANKHPIRQSLEVLKLVAKERYSVVHAHLPRAELVSLCASALLPRIITRHNSESFLQTFLSNFPRHNIP